MSNNVPLVDLAAQHEEVADEVRRGFERIVSNTSFVGGDDVDGFERAFATYCSARNCIGVANGTDAIEVLLRACGIGEGDDVIVPANTFIATVEAVHRARANPVLVDCDADHLLIDPKQAERVLTASTKAIIGVDLYGQIAPFDQLADLVEGHGVTLLEDAAQSQGATRHDRPIGTGVRGAATSFYPGKNLGAYGDAGAIVTDDDQVATDARAIANHGGTRKYEHRVIGLNSRLDAIQAMVLRAKLTKLDDWNRARQDAASRYDALLAGRTDVARVPVATGNSHVWHLYVVRLNERDRVLGQLHEAGIGAGIHYAAPVHLTEAFGSLGDGPGSFPNAEAASNEMISLPLHPHITAADQERVVHTLNEALS